MQICPKCRYERQERDAAAHPDICPACGIAYMKWLEARYAEERELEARERAAAAEQRLLALAERAVTLPNRATPPLEAFEVPITTFWQRAHYYTCFMPSDGHIAAFWAHVLVYILLLIWGGAFMLHGLDALWISASFLHKVNLPFHEYGHVMFGGFGTFWMFLGGSLFQILLPLFPLAYFMIWQRDNFAASAMLWWSGQNFIDIAPYIADAQLRALPLTTGSEDSHDWWNLLSMTGSLDFADYYASLSFTSGVCVMLLSYAWGGYLLSIEFRGRAWPEAVSGAPLP
jgi:hypothetical protein